MKYLVALLVFVSLFSCKKGNLPRLAFKVDTVTMTGAFEGVTQAIVPPPCCSISQHFGEVYNYSNISLNALITFSFSAPVKKESVAGHLTFNSTKGGKVNYNISWQNDDKVMLIQPALSLSDSTQYELDLHSGILSAKGDSLEPPIFVLFTTK